MPKHRYTLEEYFDLELSTNERFEFFDGEVFEMSGASDEHDRIEQNTLFALRNALRGKPCRVFGANMRLKVPTMPPYLYGDGSALCGAPVFEKIGGVDALTNPQLIVEVLSESTADYDRNLKFKGYKSIETFREYLLISQKESFIHHYIKQNKKFWVQTEYNQPNEEIALVTLDCTITFAEIYEGVTFPANQKPLGIEPHR